MADMPFGLMMRAQFSPGAGGLPKSAAGVDEEVSAGNVWTASLLRGGLGPCL